MLIILSVLAVASVPFRLLLLGTGLVQAFAGLFTLWLLGLFLGIHWAKDAWWGTLTYATVQHAGPEIRERTGWPLRPWRSARLDQLAHVRYPKLQIDKYGRNVTHRLIVRDRRGGQVSWQYVTVRDPSSGQVSWQYANDKPPFPYYLHLVREALARTPTARANSVTRQRLAGAGTVWRSPGTH